MTIEERIKAYLDKMPPCVEGNGGDSHLYKVACVLYNGFALSGGECVPYLEYFNQRCQPPWDRERLVYKASEAAKAKHVKARGHLLDRNSPAKIVFVPDKPEEKVLSRYKMTLRRERRFLPILVPIEPPLKSIPPISLSIPPHVQVIKKDVSSVSNLHTGVFWALDIETYAEIRLGKHGKPLKSKDALDCHKGKIRMVNTCLPNGEIVLCDLFSSQLGVWSENWLAHNASFELRFMGTQLDLFPNRVFCTMTASKLLTPGRQYHHKLGDVLERYLGVKISKELGASDWGGMVLTDEQLEYARNDVRYLHALKAKLEQELQKADLEKVFEMESQLILVTAGMEIRGFPADVDLMHSLKEKAEFDAQGALGGVRSIFGDMDLNPASPAQLVAAFAKAGVSLDSTDEETLKNMTDDNRAKLILEYRAAAKLASMVESLLNEVRDGRIHSTFNPFGATTGRFSSRDPNLQNVHKGSLRSCFVPSAPDRKLIVADYNQIELRVAALVAKDEVMIQAFKNKEDLHTKIVASIYGKSVGEVTKKERFKGKAINFGFIYGQGAEGFVRYAFTNYDLVLTLEEATQFREAFFSLYPGLKAWHSKCWELADNPANAFARTIFGRLLAPDGDRKWNRFVMFTNYVVQGSCADLIKLAMIKTDKAGGEAARLVATVHDELIFDAWSHTAAHYCTLIESRMIDAFVEMFGYEVPVQVEAKVCDNWGDK